MAIQLNPEQHDAAFSPPSGVSLISALAGTGKTQTLRARLRHLRETSLRCRNHDRVLFMAFNKSVQTELTEKIYKDFGPDYEDAWENYLAEVADTEAEPDNYDTWMAEQMKKWVDIRTFHSIALEMVRKYHKATPLQTYRVDVITQAWKLQTYAQAWLDKKPLLAGKLKRNELAFIFGVEEKRIAMGWSAEKSVDKSGKWPEGLGVKSILMWLETLRQFRYETGYITMSDAIELCANLPIEMFRAMNFQHVLADELQDLNFYQRMMVKKFMASAKSFTGVGDRFQSIYGFNGADSTIFEKMLEDYPHARVYELKTNYRSTPQVLNLANKVLEHELNTPMRLHAHDGAPSGPAPLIYTGAEGLVNWLNMLRSSGYDWKDIGILYRAKKHTPELELALSEAKIPYNLRDSSYFEQAVIQDMLVYFYLLYSDKPERAHWVRTFNHVQYLGAKTADEIWEYTGGQPLKYPRHQYPSTLNSRNRPLMRAHWNYLDDCVALKDDPVAVAEKLWLTLSEGFWVKEYGQDLDNLQERINTAESFIQWVEEIGKTGEEIIEIIEKQLSGQSAQEGDDVIDVLTVHKSKGLERKAIAIWGISDTNLPLKFGDEKEERRLIYVAVTRAKRDLALILANDGERYSVLPKHVPDAKEIVKKIFNLPDMMDLMAATAQ